MIRTLTIYALLASSASACESQMVENGGNAVTALKQPDLCITQPWWPPRKTIRDRIAKAKEICRAPKPRKRYKERIGE
jgi:hypothetical protein